MKAASSLTAKELLGLPDPDQISLGDADLAEAYRRFCESLTILEGARAIVAGDSSWVFAEPEPNLTLLRLMTALFHPNDDQIKEIRARTRISPAFASQITGTITHNIRVAQALKEMKTFRRNPDFLKLTRGTLPARTLLVHESVFMSSPCCNWWATLEASVFNENWAILMGYGDPEDNAWNSFPYVIGFAQRAGLVRNIATILASFDGQEWQPHLFYGDFPDTTRYFVSQEAESIPLVTGSHRQQYEEESAGCQEWGKDLLCICVGKTLTYGNYHIDDYGRELLKMTDEELTLAMKQFGSLLKLVYHIDKIVHLLNELDEDLYQGDQVDSIMDRLIATYGRPDHIGYFQHIYNELLDRKRAQEGEAN